MGLSWIVIALLALVQGAAELLPVSSSAHVIVAEHLLGLDPSSPEMTFLLVMLHTGTMFAVLIYFWPRWRRLLAQNSGPFIRALLIATALTGVLGLALKKLIEKVILLKLLGHEKAEIESLFGNLPLVGFALLGAGILILIASRKDHSPANGVLNERNSALIGLVQGLCLPFRGFSRSGATISTGLLLNIPRTLVEDFSFALAVLLTPPVIALELHRLMKSGTASTSALSPLLLPGLLGMVFSFIAGLGALRWLSSWLENGRWNYFGYYCVTVALVIFGLSAAGL